MTLLFLYLGLYINLFLFLYNFFFQAIVKCNISSHNYAKIWFQRQYHSYWTICCYGFKSVFNLRMISKQVWYNEMIIFLIQGIVKVTVLNITVRSTLPALHVWKWLTLKKINPLFWLSTLDILLTIRNFVSTCLLTLCRVGSGLTYTCNVSHTQYVVDTSK